MIFRSFFISDSICDFERGRERERERERELEKDSGREGEKGFSVSNNL